MTKKKLKKFQEILLAQREKVLNRTASRGTEAYKLSKDDLVDESDHAAAIVQQGLALEVQERDRRLLLEIGHALEKIEMGEYGICEDTEEPIDEARLEAQPWTRYSVEAAEAREKSTKKFVAV